ncbi:hypothetical protein [Burkholderia gladioli]|uniref:hypothetical protein n=1 Tax=Burkholderia gladioli TaxID=28095 RepID=UPI0022D382D6|nr:hypothetical protein [Burkholderia gladioli]MDA0574124.1 hypothetical protein [Burkholderia gladioli]MDA0602307.1 hypothetical protein [Burkholderia gladioli]
MSTVSIDLTQILTVEPAWFDSAPVTVDRSAVPPAQQQGFAQIDDETIAHLCGAPAGASITMTLSQKRLNFEIRAPAYLETFNEVSVRRTPTSRYLYLDFIHLKGNAPRGMGAAMLWRMARACVALGLDEIQCLASGGIRFNSLSNGERIMGYYAWPRYGFDGAVSVCQADDDLAANFPFFPDGLASGSLSRLLDLFDTNGGRQYWLIAGDERNVTFSVAPSSRSVITLHKYLDEMEFFP